MAQAVVWLCWWLLLAGATPAAHAGGRPDGVRHGERPATARGHGETQASDPHTLIAQVRFNQRTLSFANAVTAGPGAGDLEIQLAPAESYDRLLYRLAGVETDWKLASEERVVHYHLAPGHYEFDVEGGSSRERGLLAVSLPITVTTPVWQTARVQTLCVIFLLLLILVLHRLRVGFLKRGNRELQEAVNQTRAELTLTARTARDAQEALKEQALKDGLTGLWNRRAIFSMLEREICRAQRDGSPVTLAMIDLDHFKAINDTYGHPTGDEVLREAASRLIEVMRPYDVIGRYGGEEFLVVLPSCSTHHGVQRAEQFRRSIAARPVFTAAGQLTVTCSVGVAGWDSSTPPDELIRRADEALYRAKRLGRNMVCGGKQEPTGDRGYWPRDEDSREERPRRAERG